MPKYYCDYCDIFLTHDSASVRRAHNAGWKHALCVKNYYAALPPEVLQGQYDNLLKQYEGKPLPPALQTPQFGGVMRPVGPGPLPFNPAFRPGQHPPPHPGAGPRMMGQGPPPPHMGGQGPHPPPPPHMMNQGPSPPPHMAQGGPFVGRGAGMPPHMGGSPGGPPPQMGHGGLPPHHPMDQGAGGGGGNGPPPPPPSFQPNPSPEVGGGGGGGGAGGEYGQPMDQGAPGAMPPPPPPPPRAASFSSHQGGPSPTPPPPLPPPPSGHLG